MSLESIQRPWFRTPPKNFLFKNANVVDVAEGKIVKSATVKVEAGKITEVRTEAVSEDENTFNVVDCEGMYICPGLIDAHVHIVFGPGFSSIADAQKDMFGPNLLRQPYALKQMLYRGFTSIRDCGGAQLALKEAVEDGQIVGPRMFICGHALSQSGGHGDIRHGHETNFCCGGEHNLIGRIVNGAPECMRGVREELRAGADFIKIMGSGGVASPRDRIDQLQFTKDEIRAMVECASNAGTYVTAHAYTKEAIKHCIENGVRGIEHGNFIDEELAVVMKEKDIYLTPTLVVYDEVSSDKFASIFPAEMRAKNGQVRDAGLNALKVAIEAGVTICYGSDLIGATGLAQLREFAIRSQVQRPVDVLRSATINPAKMFGRQHDLGQIKEGFVADMLFLSSNPLEDVTIFDEPEKNVMGIMKEGRIYVSRSERLIEDGKIPVLVKL